MSEHHTRHDAMAAHVVDTVLITLDAELHTIAASLIDRLIDVSDADNLIGGALDRAAAALTTADLPHATGRNHA